MNNEYFSYKEYRVTNANKILFFFPAGFTKLWLYRYTIFLINKMGYTVVGFDFRWNKAVNELDLKGLEDLMNIVDGVVAQIQSENPNVNDYAIFASSFGTLLATYIAKRHKNIKSIILNMPYGKFSNVLWTHKPSKAFKETLVKNGISSAQQLHKLILPIEAQTDLYILKDRKIVNFTALKDKVVPDGQDFVVALKKANPKAIFHYSQFGHFWGGIENILSKHKWDSIL